MKKQCLYCKTEIVGRADKKFCDPGCRSAYNNQVNGARNNYMRTIDIRLKRNRRILLNQLRDGQESISTLDLIDKGFDFKYSTHTSLNEAKVEYWCYDVGFSENELRETHLDLFSNKKLIKKDASFD
jgi:hypothetical protein